MKSIIYLLRVLWAWWYFFVFTLIFFILLPGFIITLYNKQLFPYANRLRVIWAQVLFFLTGIIWRIERRGHLKENQQYVFCANHFSYLDIPVTALALRRNFSFVAKSELSNIPVLNIFFKTIDIALDRENARESMKSLQRAKDAISSGLDIVIFPEGKIDDHPPQMAEFKNGPFKLAIEMQVPIVPYTMIDNWNILFVDGWKMHGRPGIARAIVYAPIETKGMTLDNLKELKEKVFRIVDEDLKKYWNENPDKK